MDGQFSPVSHDQLPNPRCSTQEPRDPDTTRALVTNTHYEISIQSGNRPGTSLWSPFEQAKCARRFSDRWRAEKQAPCSPEPQLLVCANRSEAPAGRERKNREFSMPSGGKRNVLQAHCFRKPTHDIHVLDSLPRRTLHQIING